MRPHYRIDMDGTPRQNQHRKYQLELILLGYALGSQQARRTIGEKASPKWMTRPMRGAFSAILSENKRQVFEWLEGIGVENVNESALESIIEKWVQLKAEERTRDVVATILASGNVEDIGTLEERLEAALDSVRSEK